MTTIISMVFPGAGHGYLGMWGQAVARSVLFLWVMFTAFIGAIQQKGGGIISLTFGIVGVGLWGITAHDAYREASGTPKLVILKGRLFLYLVLGLLLLLLILLVSAGIRVGGGAYRGLAALRLASADAHLRRRGPARCRRGLAGSRTAWFDAAPAGRPVELRRLQVPHRHPGRRFLSGGGGQSGCATGRGTAGRGLGGHAGQIEGARGGGASPDRRALSRPVRGDLLDPSRSDLPDPRERGHPASGRGLRGGVPRGALCARRSARDRGAEVRVRGRGPSDASPRRRGDNARGDEGEDRGPGADRRDLFHIPPAVPELCWDTLAGRSEQGSEDLLRYIEDVQPARAYFGHVHQPLVSALKIGRTLCINVGYFRGTQRAWPHEKEDAWQTA